LPAGASPQIPLGELTALPQIHYRSWFRGWAPGKEKERGEGKGGREGKEGRESRNAQIQSWQAYGTGAPIRRTQAPPGPFEFF